MKKFHYAAMSGSYGCIPDICEVFQTLRDARAFIGSIEEYRYVGQESKFEKSIMKCDCKTPWVHSDSDTEESIRKEWGIND